MQSFKDILDELAQDNPTIKIAIQKQNAALIQFAGVFIACHFPDQHFAQGKALATDFTRTLGGVTMHNGFLGLWENSNKELVPDDILLIKSFTDTHTLANNLDHLLDRVCHWGRVCNQEAMAVEIGSFMGSVMLIINL